MAAQHRSPPMPRCNQASNVSKSMSVVALMIGQALERALRHFGFKPESSAQATGAQSASQRERALPYKGAPNPVSYVAGLGGRSRLGVAISALLLGPALSGCLG